MKTVCLKSRIGSLGPITRTLRIQSERGTKYERTVYHWNADNDWKCIMPADVWQELEHEFLDRSTRLQYKDALIEL